MDIYLICILVTFIILKLPMRELEKEPEELMFNIGLTKQHGTHSGLTGVTS